jgi:hypothetical protein
MVRKHLEKELEKRIPSLVEEIMIKGFSSHPNRELTKIGFEWAFYLAMRDHWPTVGRATSTAWLWDYLSTDYGVDGYCWTAASARELAETYVMEFGEAA